MNKIINKYLINGFLKSVVNTTLVFICLGILLNLFEEIEFFKNIDEDANLLIKNVQITDANNEVKNFIKKFE